MQSAEERRRLMNRLGSESITPLGAVLKCAAGVLVLVILAAGPWAFLSVAGPAAVPAADEPAVARANRPLPPSIAESKRVFDERRGRYVEAHPASHAGHEGIAAALRQSDAQSNPGYQAAVYEAAALLAGADDDRDRFAARAESDQQGGPVRSAR
jgi:hypothetical protein